MRRRAAIDLSESAPPGHLNRARLRRWGSVCCARSPTAATKRRYRRASPCTSDSSARGVTSPALRGREAALAARADGAVRRAFHAGRGRAACAPTTRQADCAQPARRLAHGSRPVRPRLHRRHLDGAAVATTAAAMRSFHWPRGQHGGQVLPISATAASRQRLDRRLPRHAAAADFSYPRYHHRQQCW